MKFYGKRLRLTPEEEQIVYKFREGQIRVTDKNNIVQGRLPKVLIFDIETAPLAAFIFQLKQRYVPKDSLFKGANYFMLSWSAKWLFGDEVMSDVVTPKEALQEDDKRIAGSLWNLINEADIVVSHNGKNFDHKMLNMRWLIHDIMPPTNFKVVDTYKVAKENFFFPSYSLDYIAGILGVGHKLKHEGINMWKKCLAGDENALRDMSAYNNVDVEILEDVYLIFRPWVKNHPNIGLFLNSENPVCHICGSEDLYEDGEHNTSVSKFKTLRCEECGSLSRQRVSEIPKDVRRALLTGVPGTR